MLGAVSWLMLAVSLHSITADASMAECQVRCPAGMVCVRLEGSHFHLCTRRTSLNSTNQITGASLSRAGSREDDSLAEQPAASSSHVCPPPSAASGPCVVQCRYHSDCQANQACCSNGCGYICVSTTPNQQSKPGSCPPLVSSSLVDRERCATRCQTDADCRGRQKCCRSIRCGTSCLAPCFHWLSSTRLNPWRLSHRCRY